MQLFKGEHKVYYEDRFINVIETVDYINQKVPELSHIATQGKFTQIPYSNLQMSEDFIISQLPRNKWKNIRPTKYRSKVGQKLDSNNKKQRWSDEGNRLILFVHGFSGEAEATFGDIPIYLQSEPNMNGWAMKPMGYSVHGKPELGKTIWASTYDIDRVWRYLKTSIENKFKAYDSIAIIAHGLGGLVAQKALLNLEEKELTRISHFIMFGTPNNGIDATLIKKDRYKKFKDLSSNGAFITSLRKDWNDTFKSKMPFETKTVYAIDDEYISRESCFTGFKKETQAVIDGKHFTMVKPKSKESDAYHLILSTLDSDLEFYTKYTNKNEINLALGNYNAVLKKLLPYYEGEIDPNDLYDNEVRQIVFAYEGLGQKQQALDFLKKTITERNMDMTSLFCHQEVAKESGKILRDARKEGRLKKKIKQLNIY